MFAFAFVILNVDDFRSRAMKRDVRTVDGWDFARIIPCHGVRGPMSFSSHCGLLLLRSRMSSRRTRRVPGARRISGIFNEANYSRTWHRNGFQSLRSVSYSIVRWRTTCIMFTTILLLVNTIKPSSLGTRSSSPYAFLPGISPAYIPL